MKMLNQLAIARIKKKLFAVCCLKKPQLFNVLSKVTILYIMKTATFSPLQRYRSLISIHFRNYNQREVVTKQNSEEFINIYI